MLQNRLSFWGFSFSFPFLFPFHDKHLWCVTMDIVSVVQWKQSISYWSLWYIYPINLFFPLMYEFLIIHFSFAKTAIYRKKIKIMFTWNIAHQSYIVYIRIITIQSGSVCVIFVGSLPQNRHPRRKQIWKKLYFSYWNLTHPRKNTLTNKQNKNKK